MLLKRFYDDKLAAASYLVGCAATGEALVIDPLRDVDQYVDAAKREGMRITHVTETHIHADFVSGLRELCARTGARALLSGAGGPDWRYEFAAADNAVELHDDSEFMVGNIRVQALHTPGHTPEHMSYMITDTAGADQPMGVFSGDFIFAGDVGRPDLLEKAAGIGGTTEAAARQLYASLERFRSLPEWLQLWPGHGAGSACGKSLGAVPSTTLGYEQRFNWAFNAASEQEFIDSVLAGQPEPPKYFAEMKRINRTGPRVLGGREAPAEAAHDDLETAVRNAFVVDTRPWATYRNGYVPDTINIPLNRSFTTWAGWLVPYDRPFYLIGERAAVAEAARDLAMIGLDNIAGYFTPDAVQSFAERGGKLGRVLEMTPAELRARGDDVAIVDVRGQAEWESVHMADAQHIPLGYLADRIAEVPHGRTIVTHCKGGGRSAIAASVLAAAGVTEVINLVGGIDRWTAEGNPVERQQDSLTAH